MRWATARSQKIIAPAGRRASHVTSTPGFPFMQQRKFAQHPPRHSGQTQVKTSEYHQRRRAHTEFELPEPGGRKNALMKRNKSKKRIATAVRPSKAAASAENIMARACRSSPEALRCGSSVALKNQQLPQSCHKPTLWQEPRCARAPDTRQTQN